MNESREPQGPPVRSLDARSLNGLAHPLRMRLLDALRHGGPATASQLDAKPGESSGATSYHLRRLATHGFTEDAPEHGKGRERWWKAVHKGLRFDDALLTDAHPDVRGAADLYLHEVASSQARGLSTWLDDRPAWPEERNRTWDMSSATPRLTPEPTRDLLEKMHALVGTYRDRAADDADADTAQVRIRARAFPLTTD
ncbi:winged helix-turn-helix domain-containing protein [Streptomyces sp. KMM 9044]|uniref:winged helix-turn-helix domain-containing protein n=1 Tax=Streptomyces sp. KMM 9044 TaxID=2744474 RepID=UPI0021518D70|nr:helix-turn-helix domain-containing protein [Streptomyces sp. KMM 9044]WAX82026.1 helix-turn-helix domain-containing protein [Streptomyces sp. KMM 9044]